MAITSNRFLMQNIEAIRAYDLEDGGLRWEAVDLQDATMSNTVDSVDATGKNGVLLARAERNKASTMTATNGTVIVSIMGDQVGSGVKREAAVVPFTEVKTVDATAATATLTYKPQGDTGAEIKYVYARNDDGTIGERFTIGAEVGDSTFTYSNGTVTMPASMKGKDIVLTYDVKATTAMVVENYDNQFSKEVRIVADVWVQDTCSGESYFGKIVYGRAKVSGAFDLSFGSEYTTQALEIAALADMCNAGSSGSKLWDFIVFDGDDIEPVSGD